MAISAISSHPEWAKNVKLKFLDLLLAMSTHSYQKISTHDDTKTVVFRNHILTIFGHFQPPEMGQIWKKD